jgi:hypothetical protein
MKGVILRILHHEGAAAHGALRKFNQKRVHQRLSSGCDRLLRIRLNTAPLIN